MSKVIGFIALMVVSLGAQARVYDIDTCGEVKITAERLTAEAIKHDSLPPMDLAMNYVVDDSIKREGVIKKGKGGYHVQQALFFLQEHWAHYGVYTRTTKAELQDPDVVSEVVGVKMSTLCFENLSK